MIFLLALAPDYATKARNLLRSYLSDLEIYIVTSLKETKAALETIDPDLVLLDLELSELPNWDPLQPLEWLQARLLGRSTVVVMSPEADEQLYSRAVRLGASDCVDSTALITEDLCQTLVEAMQPRSSLSRRLSRACRVGKSRLRDTKKLLRDIQGDAA